MPQETTPYTLDSILDIEVLSPTVHYFTDPIRGRPPFTDFNYTLVDSPSGLPSYSIANIMDFYLTSRNAGFQFNIPLFVQAPSPDDVFGEFDQYHLVTTSDTLRMDLISYKYYGTVEYLWIIMLANGIINPFNIPLNTILRIPSTAVVLSNWLTAPVSKQRRIEEE